MESFCVDLKNDVQCSLCNDTLTEPKILPCFHTFCKPCIKRHAELIDEVNVFNCIRCKSKTSLPEPSSIEDLRPSLLHSRILKGLALVEGEKVCSVSDSHSTASWYCFDCDRSMCAECEKNHSEFIKDHKVVRLADLKKEDIKFIITRENPCKIHPHHRLESFCEDCDEVVCVSCWKHDHKDHKIITLEKFASIKKAVLSEHLQVLEQLRLDENEKQQQEKIANKIKEQGEKAKKQLKEKTKKMIQKLQENERELIKQIDEKLETATTNLNIIHHIPAVKEYIKNVMERGLASKMMNIQGTQCRSEKFIFNPIPLSLGIAFFPNQELEQQVNKGLGEIQTKDTETDSTMSTILVEGDPELEVVEVQVNGNHVSNSPLEMNVKPQEMRITGQFNMKGLNAKLKSVTGIAVNRDNSRIAITLDWLNSVNIFNTDGDLLMSYSCLGSQGQSFYPHCIALNGADLVIADGANHRICVINTLRSKLIKAFGYQGNVDEEVFNPCAVHVDDDGNIIVCDRDNHRVQVFTRDGDYQYQFGLTAHDIFDPLYVITHDGLFYVSDHYNHVIHVFEKKGNVPTRISKIGGYGSADGQLIEPLGLAVDNNHHLLVCDTGNNRVQKFALDGRFVGKTCEEIKNPEYVTVLNDGQILVTTSSSGVWFVT